MKPKEWDLSGKNALVTVGGDFISSSAILALEEANVSIATSPAELGETMLNAMRKNYT